MLQQQFDSRARKVGAMAVGLLLALSTLASAQAETASKHVRKHPRRDRSEQSSGNSCVDAYRASQDQEKSARLQEARESLLECAKSTCGKLLRDQCRIRYTQLEDDIPSVVPLVTDDSGAPSVDVQVKLDGKPFATRIEGSALPVDPGVHEFTFEKDGSVFATQKVMIVQGQRNRPISVSTRSSGRRSSGRSALVATDSWAPKDRMAHASAVVGANDGSAVSNARQEDENVGAEGARTTDSAADQVPAPAPASAAHTMHRGWLPYALGAVGVAGLAGFGLGTYWGRKDNDALAGCNMTCAPSAVDHVQRVYLAANISLGVGIAALSAATIVWVTSGHSKEETAAQKTAYRFGVAPTSSGAVAALAGSF